MSVPEQSICQQFLFKSDEARAYAVAIVTAAVAKCPAEVSAGDVPDSAVPAGSPGLPGTVCHALVAGHVLQPVWIVWPTATTPGQCKRVMSKRGTRNGAYVNTYTLCSLGMGKAFLRMHDVPVPEQQCSLGLAVSRGRADGKWK